MNFLRELIAGPRDYMDDDVYLEDFDNEANGSYGEIEIVSPEKKEDVNWIADFLLSKKSVLLNTSKLNLETKKDILSFLSGVAYAIGGTVMRISETSFAITTSGSSVAFEDVRPL